MNEGFKEVAARRFHCVVNNRLHDRHNLWMSTVLQVTPGRCVKWRVTHSQIINWENLSDRFTILKCSDYNCLEQLLWILFFQTVMKYHFYKGSFRRSYWCFIPVKCRWPCKQQNVMQDFNILVIRCEFLIEFFLYWISAHNNSPEASYRAQFFSIIYRPFGF